MASGSVVLMFVCAAALACSNGVAGIRVGLTRIHSNPDVTGSEFMRRALHRDMHRHGRHELASSSDGTGTTTVTAPIRKDLSYGEEYLMTVAIGTPPLAYSAIADTGSDLIWKQCAPGGRQCFITAQQILLSFQCKVLLTLALQRHFKQPTRLYNPSSSITFGVLPCNSSVSMCAALAGATLPPGCICMYNQTYGTGWTSGIQGVETFTFGSTLVDQARVPGIAFGCSNANSDDWNGSAGLVGLGRGKLSLVSQIGAGKFSYCLTPFEETNSTSTLLLGPLAALNGTGVRSTPFVASPSKAPMSTYYYLNLTGISVGKTALSMPPNSFSGTGGLIIDSGTTVTSLVDAAYQQVRAAVESLVTLPLADGSNSTGLDLCFPLPSQGSTAPVIPSMTLHFDGADMVLPAENYMILDAGMWCLAMRNQTDGTMNTVGNYQQQNIHLLYDVQREMLSFAPAKCSTL